MELEPVFESPNYADSAKGKQSVLSTDCLSSNNELGNCG